jgi:type IV secretory pathway VirB4 component
MVDDPESFVVRSDEEAGKIREDATWLLDQLRPFEEEGRHANLGKSSEFDIRDEKVIYLDLAQQEGSVDSSTALTMQLLISLVYERAKETDKEVVFVIDEARYIMQDAASLAFLETVFRHHRHHDLSIRLVTQTVDEFFEHAESEAILDQCAVKQFHRLDGMDDQWADEFGLNYAQMRYVQDAVPGNEDAGFSEALVGVDGEWRGIKVEAMPKEKQVIDFDPTTQTRESLPGAGEEAVDTDVQQFREELEQQATNGQSKEAEPASAKPDGGAMEGEDDA